MTRMLYALAFAASLSAALTTPLAAGPLNPPAGPIAPTPGPEPRTAINAANTPGDADSLFRITQPGSYYLAGTITGVASKRGIEIAASNVSLDLCGFTLLGAPGSLAGVFADGSSPSEIRIQNGNIVGWGGSGIDFSTVPTAACVLKDLAASSNGAAGIALTTRSSVVNCVTSGNGSYGILAGARNTLVDCHASGNALDGINVGNDALVSRCSAHQNGGDGIDAATGAAITDSIADDNAADGFNMGAGCTVTGCAATTNDGIGIDVSSACVISSNAARSNGLDGIRSISGSLILANCCTSNGVAPAGGAGIHVTGGDNRVEGNTCTIQDTGIDADAGGNIIVRNACAGNSINWQLAANNYYGPIIDRAGAGTPAVSGSAAADALGSSHPNANFSY